MRISHLFLTVLGSFLVQQLPLQAAETCPIFNDITQQMEPIETLQVWELDRPPTGTITAEDADSIVNVRANGGIEFDIVATAEPGEAVQMLAHTLSQDCKTWFQVKFSDDRLGWVNNQYVNSDRGFGLFSSITR